MREDISSGPSGPSGLSPYSCAHYQQGRCLYDEALNPGLSEENLCVRLRGLIREWDDYLDRVEAFGLDEELALRIWEQRSHPALGSCRRGPERALAPDDMDCEFLYASLCLLALPPCERRCARYVRRG